MEKPKKAAQKKVVYDKENQKRFERLQKELANPEGQLNIKSKEMEKNYEESRKKINRDWDDDEEDDDSEEEYKGEEYDKIVSSANPDNIFSMMFQHLALNGLYAYLEKQFPDSESIEKEKYDPVYKKSLEDEKKKQIKAKS